MNNRIRIIRIDPVRRTIATMMMTAGRNATPEVARLLRAKRDRVGWNELSVINDTPLIVAGGLDVEVDMQGWRILGAVDHAGIGILFGRNGATGGMIDVPVNMAWVQSRIRWLESEEMVDLDERASEVLEVMSEDVREAVRLAISIDNGEIWLQADPQSLHATALALGIGTTSSNGQRLNPIGRRVRDMLLEKVLPHAER